MNMAISKKLYNKAEIDRINESEIYNLVFLSGFSTNEKVTDISGRGVGMDIVKKNIEKIKGVIALNSVEGQGTTFTIKLPVSLSTLETLIFESYGEKYCIPIISVNRIVQIFPENIEMIGKKEYIVIDEQYIPIESLDVILNKPRRFQPDIVEIIDDRISQRRRNKNWYNVIVISSAEKKLAVIVDRLIDEQEIVIKSLGEEFKKMKYIMGITLLGSGDLTIILDPVDLLASAQSRINLNSQALSENNQINYHVLVVDDSITTRTLEKNILEQAGFTVTIAYDGSMAWNILTESGKTFDLIISDVEMPIMTGHEFVNKVKKDDTYHMIPCILCTSLNSTEDIEKGYEAGADAYITKGDFNQQKLMEIILTLIGE
jgi:two-component system, chemotaxis family, sensor kinase CheA